MRSLPVIATGLFAVALAEGRVRAEEVMILESSGPPSLGVGAILGDPTAIGIKFRLHDHQALQFSAGWGYIDAPGSRITMMGDYLVHFIPFQPGLAQTGVFSPYVGMGALIGFHGGPNAVDFGPRVPLGLSFLVRDAPVEIFAEVAPGVLVLPFVGPMVQGGIGARFYVD
jgi:hypothetical protein